MTIGIENRPLGPPVRRLLAKISTSLRGSAMIPIFSMSIIICFTISVGRAALLELGGLPVYNPELTFGTPDLPISIAARRYR